MAINVITSQDVQPGGKAAAEESSEVKESASAQAKAQEQDEITEESDASENLESTEDSDAEAQDEEKTEGDEESSEDETGKPKKSNGFKKRIDKLNKRISQKEQELEYWKSQAMKAKPDQEHQLPDEPKLKTESSEGKPKAQDFETHEEFVEALTDWKLEQKEKAKEATAKEQELKSSEQQKLQKHNERVDEFKKTHKDYVSLAQEFFEEHGDVQFSPGLTELVVTSELGPALMYELFKNPEEFERLNKLSFGAVAKEIGKMEARLHSDNGPKTDEKKKTSAPKPLSPVGSKASGSVRKSIFDPNLSQSEYERLRAEQLKAKRT